MIFIEGNIGTGKSTFLTKLSEEFKVILEPVDEWTKTRNANGKNLLEEFYSDPARNAYLFQSIAFRSRMKNIVNQESCLIERSIYTDRNVFAKTCREDNLISDIEWNDYCGWFDWLTDEFKIKPHGFVYLRCDPTISYERIKLRKRSGEETISFDYLKKLHQKHDDWLLNEKNVKVIVINVDEDFENNPEKLQSMIDKVKEVFGDQLSSVCV
jgi:deoxyadenosine/deoxycytidine kinase